MGIVMLRRGSLAAAAFASLAGCAIHPLPENVARLDTVEIVDHIRCEMYQALRRQIVIGFARSDNTEAQAVAREIEDNPQRPLEDFQGRIGVLKTVYRNRVKAFKATTIGYGFRFNITEQNLARSNLNFNLPWNPLSNFGLNASASLDKSRTNTRRFYKVESFEELLFSKDCLAKELRGPDFVYPITGEIGLAKTVEDFIKLTTRGARTDGDAKDVKNFSEQLTFSTEISGTVAPRVRLSPVGDAFRLADANGELTAKRRDVHELTVTFALGRDFSTDLVADGAPSRRQSVIQELNNLRILDAVERSGGIVIP
jgi:hypothetical protein